MKAINPTDLASIAQIAKDLNAAIYPDGNPPAVDGVYVKNTSIEVWSEVTDRKIGTLVEHEDGDYLEFEPAEAAAIFGNHITASGSGIGLYAPGVR